MYLFTVFEMEGLTTALVVDKDQFIRTGAIANSTVLRGGLKTLLGEDWDEPFGGLLLSRKPLSVEKAKAFLIKKGLEPCEELNGFLDTTLCV